MSSPYTGNLGFLFYKHYYRGEDLKTLIQVDGTVEKEGEAVLKKKNQAFYDYQLPEKLDTPSWSDESVENFRLQTTYPGLVIGTGIIHSIGVDDEFKIGFQFDYTTGLPMIPGSSVKGLLRSAFPNLHSDDQKDVQRAENRRGYIREILKGILGTREEAEKICIDDLEREIFDGIQNGEPLLMRERDIFFAAEIVTEAQNQKIVGEDFITPHPGPLDAPRPLRFLKVLPGVTFEFRFGVKGSDLLTAKQKVNLFKRIIEDFGIGAKTNVGYGYLVEAKG